MKKTNKLSEKNFVLPTHFDLELRRKDKEGFKKLIEWLYDFGVANFEWEYTMLEMGEQQYTVNIYDLCWADNLLEIASLLSDFGQE